MRRLLPLLLTSLLALTAGAQPAPEAEPAPDPELKAIMAAWQTGPKELSFPEKVSVSLPPGFQFLPMPQAGKLLARGGSLHNEGMLGLITSISEDAEWFVVVRHDDEGHVPDEEKVDGDELLKGLREGLEEMNEERKEQGFGPLALDGWAEAPRYEKERHQLVWALLVSGEGGQSVNFNTRILGRTGYVSLNLVTDPKQLAAQKPIAELLLKATRFNPGATYADFDDKTDKTAEYGLTGLVLAGAGLGAAKLLKVGLLAKFGKVLLGLLIAGKKLIVIAVIAIGSFLKNLFGKKDDAPPPTPPAEQP